MGKFNFFVASGLIASLLSSIGSMGVYAAENSVSGKENADYMFVKKKTEGNNEDKSESKNISAGKLAAGIAAGVVALGAAGSGGYYFYRKGHKKPELEPDAPADSRRFDPRMIILYTFDVGMDRSKSYELLDFNYDILKTFCTAGERGEFLNKNGLSITGNILGYEGVDGLENKRREVERRSNEEWEKMYGDIFKG